MFGNVSQLLNLFGNIVEEYRYSVFGETQVLSPNGQLLSKSSIGNPWQYAGKRLDKESGLIAFGMRYYDPTIGRWTSPDPLGFEDGPNLYAYVHNSPIRYFDRFGLFADEFETSWDPVFPHHSILSFNDIHHGFAGTFQGGVDFLTHQIAGIGSLCCAIGANECEDPEDRLFSTLAFAESTAGHLHHFDNWMTSFLRIDPGNPIYRQHRSVATTALEVGSLAVGGYELAKGAMGLARFAGFSQQAEITGSLASGELQFARQSLASTLESRIGQLNARNGGVPRSLDLDALSRAGQVMDRGGLTRAGRALDKHGNRFGSPFPRATGSPTSKNTQGLFHLDDILTSPGSFLKPHGQKGVKIYSQDGRGVYFSNEGTFKGFVELRYE